MAFSSAIVERALLSCGRCCCLCHKFCGNKIETHHIIQGGGDEFDNCIPVCFDCHAEVGSYNAEHPKGRKFTASELKGHRDNWYQTVVAGKHFETGQHFPAERVLLKCELKYVDSEDFPVVALELVNSGSCPLYIKHVRLGWCFFRDRSDTEIYSDFKSDETWKSPLPAGMSREYQVSAHPILSSCVEKNSNHFKDVWITVETPKGEIQRMVGLNVLFVHCYLLTPRSSIMGNGRHLYPT